MMLALSKLYSSPFCFIAHLESFVSIGLMLSSLRLSTKAVKQPTILSTTIVSVQISLFGMLKVYLKNFRRLLWKVEMNS